MNTSKFPKFGINSLGKVYKVGTRIPDERIIEILLLHEEKVDTTEIAKKVGHLEPTVRKYIKKFEEGECVFNVRRKHLNSGYHTSPTHVSFLCELVQNYPITTIEKIKEFYESVYGSISMSMIYYILTRHMKLSWRKTRTVELARTTSNMRELRKKSDSNSFPFFSNSDFFCVFSFFSNFLLLFQFFEF